MKNLTSLIYPLDAIVRTLQDDFDVDDTSISNGMKNAEYTLDHTLSLYGIQNCQTDKVAKIMKIVYVAYFNRMYDEFSEIAQKVWEKGENPDEHDYVIHLKSPKQMDATLPKKPCETPEEFMTEVNKVFKKYERKERKRFGFARKVLAQIPEPDPSLVEVYANARAGSAKRPHYREY